jgi:hypothetical protein
MVISKFVDLNTARCDSSSCLALITNKASTESLLTVDCKNTVLRSAQIQFYATGAMK